MKETKKNMTEQEKQQLQQDYNAYVEQVTPKHSLWSNMWKAFLVGGLICIAGQLILNVADNMGMDKKIAGAWASIILILIGILLTGFNIYPVIAKFGGAGALVPITGFANAVAAPAVEFKKEGQVFGIGCKIFTIAGPVILYGIFTSWLMGLCYWILKIIRVI
jgi:stage V sporulation protein AC